MVGSFVMSNQLVVAKFVFCCRPNPESEQCQLTLTAEPKETMFNIGIAGAVNIVPPLSAATNLLPLANDATAHQFPSGVFAAVHETPEFVEEKIGPPRTAATILVPSAEHAIEKEDSLGIGGDFHVAPELVEIQTEFGAAAIRVATLLDDASLSQLVLGAPVAVQCVPPSSEE
jgi:hypothetical protein